VTAGVVETGSYLPPMSTTPVVNWPPVTFSGLYWAANIFANFRKKTETVLMGLGLDDPRKVS
jgi:hypothetical protein